VLQQPSVRLQGNQLCRPGGEGRSAIITPVSPETIYTDEDRWLCENNRCTIFVFDTDCMQSGFNISSNAAIRYHCDASIGSLQL